MAKEKSEIESSEDLTFMFRQILKSLDRLEEKIDSMERRPMPKQEEKKGNEPENKEQQEGSASPSLFGWRGAFGIKNDTR